MKIRSITVSPSQPSPYRRLPCLRGRARAASRAVAAGAARSDVAGGSRGRHARRSARGRARDRVAASRVEAADARRARAASLARRAALRARDTLRARARLAPHPIRLDARAPRPLPAPSASRSRRASPAMQRRCSTSSSVRAHSLVERVNELRRQHVAAAERRRKLRAHGERRDVGCEFAVDAPKRRA